MDSKLKIKKEEWDKVKRIALITVVAVILILLTPRIISYLI